MQCNISYKCKDAKVAYEVFKLIDDMIDDVELIKQAKYFGKDEAVKYYQDLLVMDSTSLCNMFIDGKVSK